jgi:hypothetical protein
MLETRNYRLLAAFGAVAAAVVMLRVFDPATSGVFPPCPVRYLTGWYCPGCGSLRAIHQLLHGNVHAAWAMNPLAILFLPFISYGLVSHALTVIRGQGLPEPFFSAGWIRALGVVIVLYGIARNLPFYPFELLAPGGMM